MTSFHSYWLITTSPIILIDFSLVHSFDAVVIDILTRFRFVILVKPTHSVTNYLCQNALRVLRNVRHNSFKFFPKFVQNSLARAIFPSSKWSDRITPILLNPHWLLVYKRIKFQIATIPYKILYSRQPSYLSHLLQSHNPVRCLSSSDKLYYFRTPKIHTALARRSFSHAAPSIWNSLPSELCNANLYFPSPLNLKLISFQLNHSSHSDWLVSWLFASTVREPFPWSLVSSVSAQVALDSDQWSWEA